MSTFYIQLCESNQLNCMHLSFEFTSVLSHTLCNVGCLQKDQKFTCHNIIKLILFSLVFFFFNSCSHMHSIFYAPPTSHYNTMPNGLFVRQISMIQKMSSSNYCKNIGMQKRTKNKVQMLLVDPTTMCKESYMSHVSLNVFNKISRKNIFDMSTI